MATTLTVSTRGAPAKDLEIRPKHVKAWAESLPLAQSVEVGRRIRDHLAGLNAARVETDDRIQILQNYRPIVSVVLEELEAMYARSTVPLPARAREALGIARELATQLAASYKIAASEKAAKLIGGKKQLPFLLLRALEYLAAALRASYKSYTPVPRGLWRELNEIYLYAESEGFAAEPADAETKASILDAYVESLFLALTDPYRLSPGELDRVLQQVRTARTAVWLKQEVPVTPTSAHFLVMCDLDRPPKPALSAHDERGGPNWRILDANALVDRLRARKEAIEKGNVSAATSKAMGRDGVMLLGKLVTLWGDPPKRTSRRDAMDSTVAICIGLKAVIHYVELERHDPQREAEMIRRGITVPLVSLPSDADARAYPVTEWEVVNQSAGGLKVRRMASSQQSVAVGELVGVKLPGRQRWTVGMVRWITVLEDGGLEFGVQFLASAARPVAIRPTITSLSTEPKAALILCEALPWQAGESLLASSNTFSDLREFEVEDAQRLFNVRATNLHEKTGRYEIFEFAPS